jgi:hypothetical protein
MISTRRKRAVVCLLLLAAGEVARGAGITSSPYFTVSYGTHCESITQYTLDAFESTYFGVRPVVVEGGYLIATYPAHSPDPKKYRVEVFFNCIDCLKLLVMVYDFGTMAGGTRLRNSDVHNLPVRRVCSRGRTE